MNKFLFIKYNKLTSMKNFTLKSSKQFISINTLFNLKKHMQVLVLALVGFLGMSQSAYAFDIPVNTTYYFDNSQTQWSSTITKTCMRFFKLNKVSVEINSLEDFKVKFFICGIIFVVKWYLYFF